MTGRNRIRVLLTVSAMILVFAHSELRAAVSCSAALDRNSCSLGEQIVLSLKIEGDTGSIEEPRLPIIDGFEVYGGGSSQRFTWNNGALFASHSYTYYLRPLEEGAFVVPEIEVNVDGTTYKTQEIPVQVTAASQGSSRPSTPDRSTRAEPSPRSTPPPDGSDDYFVTMTVDADTVVVGQQIILTFSYYSSVRGSLFDSPQYTAPATEGFWREDLPPEKHTTLNIQGNVYDVRQLQYAIFPTRTGQLEVGEAQVRLPEERFGSLFRRSRTRRRGDLILRAPAIPILVRPLPAGAPADFTGTVARGLSLRVSTDRQSLPVRDAVVLSLSLTGDGYLAAARKPALPELESFRIHDSGSSVESRPLGGRLQGSLRVEKLLIPQREGALTIPAIRYPYYDTSQGRYVTLSSRPVELQVLPSEHEPISSFASGGKTEIEILSQDILHIQGITAQLRPSGGPLPLRPAFWALVAAGPAVWASSLLLATRRRRILADPARLRSSRALRFAKERLDAEGSEALRASEALLGYVAAKAGRSAAGMTRGEVTKWLESTGVEAATSQRLGALIDRSDRERFAPSQVGAELLTDARELLEQLDREVRRG